MAKICTVKVERYNPEVDSEPYLQDYEVPIEEGWSLLNVLAYIYEELDPSVCYYGSCRVGKCVACHVKVDGKTRLACTELAQRNDMTLQPLPTVRETFIRDMVLDWSRVHPAGRTGTSDDEVD
ncbi:MAG: 2Fe-2S iron-sulfur cluster-binding protein [Nitrospinota bacterium]